MITIFNRAELFTDVNQEAAARVWSTLKANGIEYEMSTKQNVSTLRKNIHYSQGMNVGHGGIPASYFGDAPTYIYRIYVKRKDLSGKGSAVFALRFSWLITLLARVHNYY